MSEHSQNIPSKIDKIDTYEISDQAVLLKYPVVSVHMITYNHESYIAQAIEGVLVQKTDFPFELIIGEDCSTDHTRTIVLNYQKKYPALIRVITSDNNVGMMNNSLRTMDACRGKYIALCEGDDYWTDPQKLQKQVDYLKANEDCSLCFHAAEFVYSNNPKKKFIHRPKRIPKDFKFQMKHAIWGGGGFMVTNSMFFKKECLNESADWMDKAPVGDVPLMLLLASKGKVGYIDDVMSVYRFMTENSWSKSMRVKGERKKRHYSLLQMWDSFDEWSDYKYHSYIRLKKIKNIFNYHKGLLAAWLPRATK